MSFYDDAQDGFDDYFDDAPTMPYMRMVGGIFVADEIELDESDVEFV